jgi:hypothetical protein
MGDEMSVYTAIDWARRRSADGSAGIVTIWAIAMREYERLSKLQIAVPPLSQADYSMRVHNFRARAPALSGFDVVYGDIAEFVRRQKAWVPNKELATQYKFESPNAAGKLHFLSVVHLP